MRYGVGKSAILGDQYRLRRGIVLGLRQKIGGYPGRIVAGVGHDQDLRRAGDQVDADLSEDAALGGGDVGVARPGDLVDRLDRLGAVGERRHGLGATDAPDLVGAGDAGGQHDQRIDHAIGRRHDHDDAPNACHLGRHNIHQHRRRIGRGAARHVDTRGIDGPIARPQPCAGAVREVDVFRQQRAMKSFDALGGEYQGFALRRRYLGGRFGAFGLTDPQARRVTLEPVELLRVIDQRRIASCAHIGHDLGHHTVDILVGVPVAPEEGGEVFLETRRRGIEPKRRHD